jgi:hypothetical protein
MVRWILARAVPAILLAVLVSAGPAAAQAQVQVRTSPQPAPGPRFEITAPGPAVREAPRPREAEHYREDVRVRHEPAFIEPFTGRPASGPVKTYGLSGWTAPPAPGGAAVVQAPNGGWFGFGFSLVWE